MMQFIIHVSVLILNSSQEILLVQEKRPVVAGLLNLPGGHLELGEGLIAGAKREVQEETGVEVELAGLVGIYTGYEQAHYLNFVFKGKVIAGEPKANLNDVMSCAWYKRQTLADLPTNAIMNPQKFQKILWDAEQGKLLPLDAIAEDIYPNK